MTGSNNGNGKNGGKKDTGRPGWEEAREKMTEMLPGTAMAMMGKQVARVARVKQGMESPEGENDDTGHESAGRRAMTPPAQEERTGKVPVGKLEGKSDGHDGVGHPIGRQDSGIEGTGDEDDAGQSGKFGKGEERRLTGMSLEAFLGDEQGELSDTEDAGTADEIVAECPKCGNVTDAIYIMVEKMRRDGEISLGPGGVKAVLPHTVKWSHEQVDALIELMAIADTLNLTLFTLCKLIIGRYAKSMADVALGRVQYVYDLVEEAMKTLQPRFSHMVWEQVKQLSALYVKQTEAVGTPPGLQQVPVATQNVLGTGLGSQGVIGGIGGGVGRPGQGSGRQSRASGTGGRRLSGGSHGSNGVKRQGTGSRNEEFDGNEEDDYVVEVDSRSKRNTGNNTAVKIIEREKEKKSFSGPYNGPRYRIGDTSFAIGWIGSFHVYCALEGVPKDRRWELLKRSIGNNESFADWYLECRSIGIEEDWDQVVQSFLKKYASDEEADASLFLKTLTTFARKPNERVQEYADWWNHQVHIFKYINDFAEEEDKASGLGYDFIVTTKPEKLKVILIERTWEGFVKQVTAKIQEIELNTWKQSELFAARETVKQHPVLAYKSEIYRDEDEKGGGFSKSERDQLEREWERLGREKERFEREKRGQSHYRLNGNGGNYGSATVVTQQPASRTAQAVGGDPAGVGNGQSGTTFVSKVNSGGRQCYRCGSVEHLANVCPDKPKKLLCFKCHEEGHPNQCPHGEEKESNENKGFLLSTHNTPGYGYYEECEDTYLIFPLQRGYYLVDP
ncbi:hypothetical protein HDV00_011479 [Rhizophlyctis rosea]|nr:hypothetical protein HDV00_011479 [Rhizophlyctis rosea]